MTQHTHIPSYRPASTQDAPRFRRPEQRQRSAAAFTTNASSYHDIRPSYPTVAAELINDATRVLDIGAGTGKFTEVLTSTGPENREVFACDPSADMVGLLAQRLDIPVWRAVAEATGSSTNSFDAVTLAQTWHWVDTAAACAELDRIVRPTGHVVLVWNSIDVSDPWVLRLARIMHSGDIMKEGFTPELAAPFSVARRVSSKWSQALDTDGIFELTATRSYWLRSSETIRDRVRDNLRWYLFEHTGLTEGDVIELPYRTEAFLITRA